MKKSNLQGVEILESSGNIYADLGMEDAAKLKIKSDLVIQIIKAMKRLGLTQDQAAKRMGISQPKVSGMIRGDFSNLSERKLMDCLARLGFNIEIRVRPVKQAVGQLVVLP
jgi:predicted XRE-type DNA-binding protein